MKQRIARTFIAIGLIYLLMQICYHIRLNRELIQRQNRQMAIMFDELRQDQAPADFEDFVILEAE